MLPSPSVHAEEGLPHRVHYGLAPGAGYFLYSQKADRGFFINGRSYDLVWSGLQLQLAGDLHFQLPLQRMGLGFSAAFMLAPNPTGAASGHSVDPDKVAFGGQFALSMCFLPNDGWRLSWHGGAGKNGASGALGYGGWGVLLGASVHRMLGAGTPPIIGIGLRLTLMRLWASQDGDVRGEKGVYGSLVLEVLFRSTRVYARSTLPPMADTTTTP